MNLPLRVFGSIGEATKYLQRRKCTSMSISNSRYWVWVWRTVKKEYLVLRIKNDGIVGLYNDTGYWKRAIEGC